MLTFHRAHLAADELLLQLQEEDCHPYHGYHPTRLRALFQQADVEDGESRFSMLCLRQCIRLHNA